VQFGFLRGVTMVITSISWDITPATSYNYVYATHLLVELHPQVVLITYPLLNSAFPFLIRQNTDLSFAKSGRGDRTKEDHVVNPMISHTQVL
jgi:hypothetical protein